MTKSRRVFLLLLLLLFVLWTAGAAYLAWPAVHPDVDPSTISASEAVGDGVLLLLILGGWGFGTLVFLLIAIVAWMDRRLRTEP